MLFPSVTGFGDPEAATARSAWPAVATIVVALDSLFDGFGSGVDEEIVALEVSCVPEAVTPGTLTVRLKVELLPAAYVPVATHDAVVAVAEQVQPAGLGNDTNVVPAGMEIVSPAPIAPAGP
jgi:hypothetical protein